VATEYYFAGLSVFSGDFIKPDREFLDRDFADGDFSADVATGATERKLFDHGAEFESSRSQQKIRDRADLV
jgi:hypothetical protein